MQGKGDANTGQYQNISEDPAPPIEWSTKEEKDTYAKQRKAHNTAMMKVYQEIDIPNEKLW